MSIRELPNNEVNYPPLLNEVADPPQKIFARGELPSFSIPWIAIVGTRKATEEGLALAKKTAKELAEKEFVIVSGLAMGIDTAAHEGAIKGGGKTVAVLGTSIQKIYPAQNENLANRIILSSGAVISEYRSGASGFKHQFLERNRIIAGLCVATVVIEAPEKSGALATARFAAESGREVFVFPGPAGHPQWVGSHALIRDGARLVNSTKDILEDLGSSLMHYGNSLTHYEFNANIRITAKPNVKINKAAGVISSQEKNYSVSEKALPAAEQILNAIRNSKTPLSIDKILGITKLTPQEANKILTGLIIRDIVEEQALGYKIKNQK